MISSGVKTASGFEWLALLLFVPNILGAFEEGAFKVVARSVLRAFGSDLRSFAVRPPVLSLGDTWSMSWKEFLCLCTSSFFTFDAPTAAFGGALIEGGDDDFPKVLEMSFPPRLTLSLLERSVRVSYSSDQCSGSCDVDTDQRSSSRQT